ncbi:MAG: type II secretion system GspH family protein [Lentisphaeria bacterium]|nr:type II secretion system GspH family protein [Lentisphaeria bacterium]
MNKHSFTLTELLIAIGIIVILAAMAIPVTAGAIKKAETAKAQAEMSALVTALKNFESTYGTLPLKCFTVGSGDIDGTFKSDVTYEKFIKMLQGVQDVLTVDSKKINPRNVKFMDVQENTEGQYTDPWDNDYKILIDANGDGKIKTDSDWPKGLDKPSDNTFRGSIIIYSAGPDGDFDKIEDNVYSIPVTWDKGEKTWLISK